MATATVVNNTSNQLTANYDFAEVILGDNTFESGTYKNTSGSIESASIGTLIGRVSATGLLVKCIAAATDGSQYPVGVLASATVDVAIAGEVKVSVCVSGDVAKGKVIFNSTDTIATVVSGRQFLDLIPSATLGIKLLAGTELTGFDNN